MVIPIVMNDFDELRTFLTDWGLGSYLIAGGAVRDTIFGKPVKDIDVFYLQNNIPSTTLNTFKVPQTDYIDAGTTLTHKIPFIFKGQTVTVELIRINRKINEWTELLKSFPVSISQVGVNNAAIVIVSTWFKATNTTNTIAYDPDPKYINYLDRINEKYPHGQPWVWEPIPGLAVDIPDHGILSTPPFIWEQYTAAMKKKNPKVKKYKVLNHPEQIEREFM